MLFLTSLFIFDIFAQGWSRGTEARAEAATLPLLSAAQLTAAAAAAVKDSWKVRQRYSCVYKHALFRSNSIRT